MTTRTHDTFGHDLADSFELRQAKPRRRFPRPSLTAVSTTIYVLFSCINWVALGFWIGRS